MKRMNSGRSGWIGLCVFGVGSIAWAGEWDGRLHLQLGPEADTNIHRMYDDKTAGALLRLVGSGNFHYMTGNHDWSLGYEGGGKLFLQESGENLLVNAVSGAYLWYSSDRLSLGLRGSFQDHLQEDHGRDYQLFDLEGVLYWRIFSWLDSEWFAGGRAFRLKAGFESVLGDEIVASLLTSYAGPVGGLRLSLSGWAGSVLSLNYQVETRFTDALALGRLPSGDLSLSGEDRLDMLHVGGLGLRKKFSVGERRYVILDAQYSLSFNDSNSENGMARWHRIRGMMAVQFPWSLSLYLMATVQFRDRFVVSDEQGRLFEPDADENENSVIVRLTYSISERLHVVLQGSLYRNEFRPGDSEMENGSFARETLMLAIALDWLFRNE